MKNLVFRCYLLVTLCWHSGIAKRSANGYFYDKPEGALFDEAAGRYPSQRLPSVGGFYRQQILSSRPAIPLQQIHVEVYPANLVYENWQTPNVNLNGHFQQQGQQQQQQQEHYPKFVQPQQTYRDSIEDNFHPLAFAIQGDSSIQQSCGPEPIVAQVHPDLVNYSNGGPLTRHIKTCGPNNDCTTITVQSDFRRHLGAFPPQSIAAQDQSNRGFQVLPRSFNTEIQADETTPLVRPASRRMIQYSEIEQEDVFN